jgi:hypothetical protein|nr:MAG TPA: hypothetical protein [Caudoviricetes sp.]
MSGIMTAVAVANAAMGVYKSMSSTQEFPAMMDERLKQSGQAGKILYSYDGSITKLLSDYIVEPTIVVSKELRDTEVLPKVIQAQVDVFASYYAQAFNVLSNVYEQNPLTSVKLLASTGKDTYSTLKVMATDAVLKDLATESYTQDLLCVSMEDKDNKRPGFPTIVNQTDKGGYLYALYTRQFEVSVNGHYKNVEGKDNNAKIIIPITIRANVIFTSYDNIENILGPNNDKKSFWYRWNEYLSGGISFMDLVTAGDLVREYKKNRLLDSENILQFINAKKDTAAAKGLFKNSFGFEYLYNMYILTIEDRARLSKYLGGNVANDKFKEKFLSQASGMVLTTVDNDYEKVIFQIKDLHGETIVPYSALNKRKGDSSDLAEIFKALMVNKQPTF